MRTAADFAEEGVLFLFFSSVLFLVVFGWYSRWWRYDYTWVIASLDIALLIALMPATLHYLAGLTLSQTGFAWYYSGSLNLAGLVVLWRTVSLRRMQKEGREADGGGS